MDNKQCLKQALFMHLLAKINTCVPMETEKLMTAHDVDHPVSSRLLALRATSPHMKGHDDAVPSQHHRALLTPNGAFTSALPDGPGWVRQAKILQLVTTDYCLTFQLRITERLQGYILLRWATVF